MAQGLVRTGERVPTSSGAGTERRQTYGKPLPRQPTGSSSDLSSATDFDWISNVAVVEQKPADRRHVTVGPGESQTFWAYWESDTVDFPLHAVIHVNDRRLLMRFEGP